MEVKNRKTEFKPIVKIGNEKCIIMWDYKPIMKKNNKGIEVETPLAVWQEEAFNYLPLLDEIKEVILGYYNKQVDQEILSGFVWKNMNIWLSNENQFNYKAMYDIAVQTGGKSLPIVMKFGTTAEPVYYEFRTMEDLTDFYFSSLNHIQNTLKKGWEIKDNINWKLYQ